MDEFTLGKGDANDEDFPYKQQMRTPSVTRGLRDVHIEEHRSENGANRIVQHDKMHILQPNPSDSGQKSDQALHKPTNGSDVTISKKNIASGQ